MISPESRMAMMVPRPSYSGKRLVKERAPVSLLGCSDHSGKTIVSDASSAVGGGMADEDELGCMEAAAASMFTVTRPATEGCRDSETLRPFRLSKWHKAKQESLIQSSVRKCPRLKQHKGSVDELHLGLRGT